MPNNHTFATKKVAKSLILGVKFFSIRQLFFSLLILSSLLTLNFIRYSFFETPKTIAESSTPTGADNPTLSLTINGSNQINYSDSSITEKSATTNIKVKTDNETGYVVNFSNQAADTTLYNSDTSSNSKITSIISDTTILPSNTYGWSLDNTTFQPIPAITQPKDIIKTEEPTDNTGETHELHIKTKINNTLDAGTYSTNLTFSVITNNAPTRAEFMANFNTTFRNYLDNNGINITTTRFARSQSIPTSTTPTFTASSPTSRYEIKAWLDQSNRTFYWYSPAEIANFNENSIGFFGSQNNFNELTDIDLTGTDAKNIIYASDMFAFIKAPTIDLSNFKPKKIQYMNNMFGENTELTSLNLSTFDTKSVKEMTHLFGGDTSLTNLNISKLNTQNVTTMKYMFKGVPVETLDLSHFNTKKVEDMSYMFYQSGARELILHSFNTSNVKTTSHMFDGMPLIGEISTACFDTGSVTDMSYMYANLPNLHHIYFGHSEASDDGLEYRNKTENTENLSHLFYNLPLLRGIHLELDMDTLNRWQDPAAASCIEKVGRYTDDKMSLNTARTTDMSYMFSNLPELTNLKLNFDSFDTQNVTNMSHMFSGLKSLQCFSRDSNYQCLDYNYIPNEPHQSEQKTFANLNTSNVTNMESMFEGLESYNFYNPNATDIDYYNFPYTPFFPYVPRKLDNIIQFKYDMTNVTNAKRMFANTYKNQALDISGMRGLDKPQNLDASEMFYMDDIGRSDLRFIIGVNRHCSEHGNGSPTFINLDESMNPTQYVFKNTDKLISAYPLPKDILSNISNTALYSDADVRHFDSNYRDKTTATVRDTSGWNGNYLGYFSGTDTCQ